MGLCRGLEIRRVLLCTLDLASEISLLLSRALNLTSEISLFLSQFSPETLLLSCYSTNCLYDLTIQGNSHILRYGRVSLGYHCFSCRYAFRTGATSAQLLIAVRPRARFR
jgi:hypothetical protein